MLKGLLLLVSTLFLTTYTYGINKLSSQYDGFIIKYKNNQQMMSTLMYTKSIKTVVSDLNMVFVKELPSNLYYDDNIEYVEPNYIYHAYNTPTDPGYSKQWNMKKINAEKAWDVEEGSESTVVAVIDTGVDYTHQDLKNQMWVNRAELNGKPGVDDDGNGFVDDIYGYNFAGKKGDPMDDNEHGTHCAGVIGAEHNNVGVVGVNKHVRIMAVKFLTKEGSGTLEDAVLAIKYAVDNGANVLSNSWGGGDFSQSLYDVIKYAQDHNVLFVAASGNESSGDASYPAGYQLPNVISVAASDSSDNMAYFSNYGVPHVHVAAPGVGVYSSIPGNKYTSMDGTSMACPHVAGAAAMLISHERNLTYADVKDRILWTSDYLPNWEDKVLTSGRLNLYNMLMNIRPNRPLPPEDNAWQRVNYTLSTSHPYADNQSLKYTISVPQGATYLRIHFSAFDTEKRYDPLTIRAGTKELSYSGKLGAFNTGYLKVSNLSKVDLSFVSDRSQSAYGWDIDYIEIQ